MAILNAVVTTGKKKDYAELSIESGGDEKNSFRFSNVPGKENLGTNERH